MRLVKRMFPGNPRTLCIGDSFNDAVMMKEADVSVQLVAAETDPSDNNIVSEFGDVLVK